MMIKRGMTCKSYNLHILDQVLTTRLQNSPINDWDDLFNRIAIFILECNGEQIRYSANNFAELCHLFADQLVSVLRISSSNNHLPARKPLTIANLCFILLIAIQIQRNTAIVGIPALLKAITKIQLSETSLTSVHADVCKLCLASKCFSPAVNNLLNIDYVDIAKEATQDPKHILLFFYYGGMIFTALKVSKIFIPTLLAIKLIKSNYNHTYLKKHTTRYISEI